MRSLINNIQYGIKLNFIQHQFNRDRNLLIHHGLMGSAKNFRNISKNIAFSKYVNSYLIDARNHGDSPHTETHTLEDLADDLYQFITTHNLDDGNRKLTLMGHSMGALAIQQFTKKYSSQNIQAFIDRIILIDISCTPINFKESYYKIGKMLQKMVKIDLSQPLKQIYAQIDEYAINPSTAALLKTDIIKINEDLHKWRVNLPTIISGYQSIGNFRLDQNNDKSWKVPVQVIYGQLSGYVTEIDKDIYKEYYPQMNESNFYEIKNAGHWVHFDQTQIYLKVMEQIFKKDSEMI